MKAQWPRPWRPWHGNYQKTEYDIVLHNRRIYYGCWPNAGKMSACDNTGKTFTKDQIRLIRRAKWPLLESPPEGVEFPSSVKEIVAKRNQEPTYHTP